MMQQYRNAKRACPEALLLFRMGDFYEVFYEDAQTAARVLKLTLTSREKGENACRRAGHPCSRAGSVRTMGAFPETSRIFMQTHSTTILTVRHRGAVAIGGDGQVTLGNTIMKADANKIRRLHDQKVITGFAGSSADAFALLERFEAKLKDYPGNVPRAATELAKDWRTDRALRRLEALLAVVDEKHTLLVTGNGDVIQPTDGVLGIGSGGNFAVAAARALMAHADLSAAQIVRKSLEIAAGIDIYTNLNIAVEEMPCAK